jgi:hypothetical protein
MGLAAAASLEGFPYRDSRYWGFRDEHYKEKAYSCNGYCRRTKQMVRQRYLPPAHQLLGAPVIIE